MATVRRYRLKPGGGSFLVPGRKKTRVWALVGDLGSGKTFMSVAFLLYYHRKYEYEVYANIDLKGELEDATRITGTGFVDEVPKDGKPKIILVDEMGTGTRDVHSQAFDDMMTLARKLIGEDIIILLTTPLTADIEKRLKGKVDLIGTVKKFVDKDTEELKKFKASFRERVSVGGFTVGFRRKPTKHVSTTSLGVSIDDIFASYNTGEVSRRLLDERYMAVCDEFEEYIGKKKERIISIKTLGQMIQTSFGVSKAQGEQWAGSILHGLDTRKRKRSVEK